MCFRMWSKEYILRENSMVKAVFADFYGTIVFEDGENVSRISNRIFETGKAESPSQVGGYWWARGFMLIEANQSKYCVGPRGPVRIKQPEEKKEKKPRAKATKTKTAVPAAA